MALIGSVSGSVSGSLTTLGNGRSYLKAGSGVTITTGSDGIFGQVEIAVAGGWGDAGDILYPGDGASESVGVGATSNTAGDYDIYLGSDGGSCL